MKKYFFFLCVSVLALFLASCSASETFKDGPNLTSITGILTEQSGGSAYLGTHLITNGKVVTPVRSLSINLSSDQYLDNKVSAIGVMNDVDNVFEITGISVLEILRADNVNVEFKIYKNTDFGVELKYYSDWTIEESPSMISFSSPSSDGLKGVAFDMVAISQSPFAYEPTTNDDGVTDTALLKYAGENYPDVSDPKSLINKVGIGPIDALKSDGDNNNVDYFLYRDGFIYKFSFEAGQNYLPSNKKVFNQMLAEFKFIGFTVNDSTGSDLVLEESVVEDEEAVSEVSEVAEDSVPVVDMKLTTFESLPYFFSAKYPASWYYAGISGYKPGVLHHYGFSDEAVTDSNEILSLDVLSGSVPDGQKVQIDGRDFTIVSTGALYSVYTTVANKNYEVSGNSSYADLIKVMAVSITEIKVPVSE